MKPPAFDEPGAGSSLLPRTADARESMRRPFRLDCRPPLLVVRFDQPVDIVGWSILKPGFASTREVVWLEVRDGDLPIHVDPIAFLKENLAANALDRAAAFMTSRDIRRHHVTQSCMGDIIAACVTTVGLSNAERIDSRRRSGAHAVGTINTLVHVSRPLSPGAFIEAVSIVTEARTAAVMETSGQCEARPATGTGTDCIIVAAPTGDTPENGVGLHTDLGVAIGAAVYDATIAGAREWVGETAETNSAPRQWRTR